MEMVIGFVERLNVIFIGIGEMVFKVFLVLDGFLRFDEMEDILKVGVVGEICGWIFGVDGKLFDYFVN